MNLQFSTSITKEPTPRSTPWCWCVRLTIGRDDSRDLRVFGHWGYAPTRGAAMVLASAYVRDVIATHDPLPGQGEG